MPILKVAIPVRAMRSKTIGALLSILFCAVLFAQQRPQSRNTDINDRFASRETDSDLRSSATRSLNLSEGLAILGAALESRHRGKSGSDCSHLVQAIYEKAGFSYSYANSSELYAGIDQFRRVAIPQPGDLAVWRGHPCCGRGLGRPGGFPRWRSIPFSVSCTRDAGPKATILHIGSGAALLAFSGMSKQLRTTLFLRPPGMRV